MTIMKKEHVWPTIVVVVLAGYVTFGLVAARIATNDSSFAIESDYYTKAVAWDSTLEQGRRNVALGWHIVPTLGRVGRGRASQFVLDVHDSSGVRVNDARVTVEARQVAHAADVVRATLSADSSGTYVAGLPLGRSGLWEMRIVATRGTDRYASSVRLLASESAGASVVADRPGDPLAARTKAGTRREDARGASLR